MASSSKLITPFLEQLSSMIDAGIPLLKSLTAVERQTQDKKFKAVLHQVWNSVESGTSLSDSLKQHPDTFSFYVVSMIYSGERGAGLSVVLRMISEYLKKDAELKGRVRRVLMYPAVVGTFCLLIITFLIVAVIPIFANVYGQMGVTLPFPTRILLGVSQVIRTYWAILVAGIGGIIFLLSNYRKSPKVMSFFGRVIRHTPVLGTLIRKVAVAQFLRVFASMLACHVSLSEALDVMSKVLTQADVAQVVQSMQQVVASGGTVTQALEKSTLFSPMVIQMAQVGEDSGNLGPLMEKCAAAAESEVEALSKNATTVLEPLLTLGLSFVIGFIALAIYLPMFSLMGKVGK